MNGIDKDSLKNMSADDMLRGLIDMVYHLYEKNETYWKEQPPICRKRFVQIKHVKIIGVGVIAFLLGYGILTWADVISLIP